MRSGLASVFKAVPVEEPSEIACQTEYPYILLNGVKHYTQARVVRLCELLLRDEGKMVYNAYLMEELGLKNMNVLRQYVYWLREVIEPRGWFVINKNQHGYAISRDFTKTISLKL